MVWIFSSRLRNRASVGLLGLKNQQYIARTKSSASDYHEELPGQNGRGFAEEKTVGDEADWDGCAHAGDPEDGWRSECADRGKNIPMVTSKAGMRTASTVPGGSGLLGDSRSCTHAVEEDNHEP